MHKTTSNKSITSPPAFRDFPLADSDQCVKCGLCLPHCPTYKLSLHEGDSPRGRIALMQGLSQGVIEPRGTAVSHLDGCLVCRACEPVCPAQVPYGKLIDAGRAGLWRAGHRPGPAWRLLAFFRRTPKRIAWLTSLVRASHATGLAALARHLPLGKLKRIARYAEHPGAPPDTGRYVSANAGDRNVALFLGCIARPLDHAVLNASIRVLNAMDFNVDVPADQGCCGAMDAHAGDTDSTRKHARNNLDAFHGTADAVISTASGCGVQLQEYGELLPDAESFSERVHDVMQFVADNIEHLPSLRHAPARVAVHSPCTLKNGMRESGAMAVLKKISGLQVEPLQHNDCCGAAGSYLFEHPETADRLGNRLLDALGEDIPDVLVTSNVGCALHVRRLARLRGLQMKVMHPVEVVAAGLEPGMP